MATNFDFSDISSSNPIDNNAENSALGATPDKVKESRASKSSIDPRTYNVTLTDPVSPMVILFGPPSCGKTMTLVRLTRFLSGQYDFMPDQAFKNSDNDEYQKLCSNFNAAVGSDAAAQGTKYIDFMLLRVNDKTNGRTLCQFVESPGEFLFDPKKPDEPFPAYLNQIIASNNRKIWLVFLEAGLSQTERFDYVRKIQNLKSVINHRDKVIFVVNKIDLLATRSFIISPTEINMGGLINYANGLYPGLFESFTRKGIFWTTRCFDFTAFQTGTYVVSRDQDGKEYKSFQSGHDSHPARLWSIIKKRVRG